MATLDPPKLETQLDSTSFTDMFVNLHEDKSEETSPTGPKVATPNFMSTNSNDTYDSQARSPTMSRKPVPLSREAEPPAPPPKSYNPAMIAPKVQGIVKEKVQTFNTYSVRPVNGHASPDTNDGGEWSMRPEEEALMSPTAEEKPRTSTTQSRNLTHTTPAPIRHQRDDSLTAPPRNNKVLPKTPGSEQSGMRRGHFVKRKSIPADDDDAAIISNNVHHRHQASESAGPRGLSDRVKSRDSGWDEAGSASSSANSLKDNASFASSKDTAHTSLTSPRSTAVSRANTEENFTSVKMHSGKDLNSFKGVELKDEPLLDYDNSIADAVALAARFDRNESDSSLSKQSTPKKVMTTAEYERLRREQDEARRRKSHNKTDSDTDSDSDNDYDSETEHNQEIAKQRRKQEAHLSVYRQQMQKVTGSTHSSTDLPNRGSAPMLSLNNSMPQLSLQNAQDDPDSDDDVPLGILAAHGFPKSAKPRPATRMSNSSSQPNLRGTAQAQAIEGGRLPAFARNLPADPFNYNSGLMQGPVRMSMGMGAGMNYGPGPGSVAGGSVYGGDSPQMRPVQGGLIGEIMLAEEQKAARRSNNGRGNSGYTAPGSSGGMNRNMMGGGGLLGLGGGVSPGIPMNGGMQMGMGGMGGMGMNGMNGMGMQQPFMAPNPANAQLQQMQNAMMMMQAQMAQQQQQFQMAQQMQQQQQMNPMMGMGMGMGMGINGMGGMGPGGMARPNSVMVPQSSGLSGMNQRTMSMVDPMLGQQPMMRPGYAGSIAPSMMNFNPVMPMPQINAGYTPSIAPSERSVIGQPSRYRPVSQMPGAAPSAVNNSNSSRSSTMTSGLGQNWNAAAQARVTAGASGLRNSTVKADDDDDEDEGWEKLKAKKEEKKDSWKKKKGLGGLLGFGGNSGGATASAST